MSLADVLPNCLEALQGRRGAAGLAPVTHAIVLVADGLGWEQLATHRGHARTLGRRSGTGASIESGFPTTTAAALASLTTGTRPGEHGMLGYTVYDEGSGAVVRLLDGWIPDGGTLDPARFQRMPTCFEAARGLGIRPVAISSRKYADSGFTRAVLRGADFVGADGWARRLDALGEQLAQRGPALIYLYVSELDVAGHRNGVGSDSWLSALEDLDAGVAAIERLLGPRQGMLVTADHGMVNVPEDRHRIVPPDLLRGAVVGGEPRCLQVYYPDSDGVPLSEWRDWAGEDAWIAGFDEVLAAGWFGDADINVLSRIGDVFVAARGHAAFYDDENSTARRMVGQHGSLTSAELAVPLLRFGAFG